MIPFVGASAALPFGDSDDFIDYEVGGEAGVRFMPSDRASINFAAFYNRQFAADDFDDFDQWGVQGGISIFFGN
jgi:hypothetical protein